MKNFNEKFHPWVIAALTIALIFVAYSQLSLAKNIKETNEELYLKNKYPDIILGIEEEYKNLHRNIITSLHTSGHPSNYIFLKLLNIGETPTGPIRIRIRNSTWASEEYVDFQSLKFGEFARKYISLTTKECMDGKRDTNGHCDEKIIPLGIQNITFEIECMPCKEEIYNESIEICIYENKTRDCKLTQ